MCFGGAPPFPRSTEAHDSLIRLSCSGCGRSVICRKLCVKIIGASRINTERELMDGKEKAGL